MSPCPPLRSTVMVGMGTCPPYVPVEPGAPGMALFSRPTGRGYEHRAIFPIHAARNFKHEALLWLREARSLTDTRLFSWSAPLRL